MEKDDYESFIKIYLESNIAVNKPIQIQFKDWVRMMYCVKHLMKLHPSTMI